MNTWIAWALALPAFAALSQAMETHHKQTVGVPPSSRAAWLWRAVGLLLLLLSLTVCVHTWSTSVAVAAWLGVLTLAALPVGLMLTYVPRYLRTLAAGCAVVGVIGMACIL